MKKIKQLLNILKNTVTFTIPFYVLKIKAHAGSYDFLGNASVKDENIEKLGNALKKRGQGCTACGRFWALPALCAHLRWQALR